MKLLFFSLLKTKYKLTSNLYSNLKNKPENPFQTMTSQVSRFITISSRFLSQFNSFQVYLLSASESIRVCTSRLKPIWVNLSRTKLSLSKPIWVFSVYPIWVYPIRVDSSWFNPIWVHSRRFNELFSTCPNNNYVAV